MARVGTIVVNDVSVFTNKDGGYGSKATHGYGGAQVAPRLDSSGERMALKQTNLDMLISQVEKNSVWESLDHLSTNLSHPAPNRIPFPLADELARKKLERGLFLTGHADEETNNPTNQAVLAQVLEHINAVPSGQVELSALKKNSGEAIFLTRAELGRTSEGKYALPVVARAVPFGSIQGGDRGVAIYVNTPYINKIFRGEMAGGIDPTPAKALREVYAVIYEAAQLNEGGVVLHGLAAERRLYAHEVAKTLKSDAFYGQLTHENNDGRTFSLELNHVLGTTVFPGTQAMAPSGQPGLVVMDSLEQIYPALRKAYVQTIGSAAHLSGGVQLGLQLFDSGGGKETPIRVALTTLDERHGWYHLDLFNRHLDDTPQLKNDRTSLRLRNIAADYFDADPSGEKLRELAEQYQSNAALIKKAGREELMTRVMAEIQRLVDRGAYSKQDVAEMIAGLKLPERLRTFFDRLLGSPVDEKPGIRQKPMPPKIAKLQASPAAS